MAKKFVRGVTDVENIESFDKTLTNVNDIVSDGQNSYVHTKKGKNESYYNLTDNLKEVESDDSTLITVTKDDTTNTATLHPKHDDQKEQQLESTRNTVTLQKGENGTSATTKLDTNPEKVLEHNNLKTGDGLQVVKNGNTSTISLDTTKKSSNIKLSSLSTSIIYGNNFSDGAEKNYDGSYVTIKISDNKKMQLYARESAGTPGLAIMSYRFVNDNTASGWSEMSIDALRLQYLLNLKHDKINSNTSIAVDGTGLRQLYALKKIYTHSNGVLKTYVKSLSNSTAVGTLEEEFNFIVKIDKNVQSVYFTLNEHDTTKFTNIMSAYGSNNTVSISGCVLTLSGSTLTVSTANNTNQNYVITFSDII